MQSSRSLHPVLREQFFFDHQPKLNLRFYEIAHSEALLFGGKVVLCLLRLWIRKTSSVSFPWKSSCFSLSKNQATSVLGSQVQPKHSCRHENSWDSGPGLIP